MNSVLDIKLDKLRVAYLAVVEYTYSCPDTLSCLFQVRSVIS